MEYNSSIIDNHQRGNVGDFLKNKITNGSKLSFVSAYFTIYAYERLKEQLDNISSLDFLFGEPKFVRSLDPSKTDKKAFNIEDSLLTITNRLNQKAVARSCAKWITEKVQIRSIKKSNLMHGKMYYIENHGQIDALTGSSNFTTSGLGLSDNSNIELNIVVQDNRDRQDIKKWFDNIWNDETLVEDVKQEVLSYLEQIYQDNSPEFVYFKTLYHIFEKYLSEQEKGGLIDENVKLFDTRIWDTLYSFQKDAVKGAINKIEKHNGCIIADSVGLGKTYEALAIIKYYELLNRRTLVLCPKKLKDNWTIYLASLNSELNPFETDRFNYTVLCHTDLSRLTGFSGDIDLETFKWGNYDLVVIDESHNFRNNTKGSRDETGKIIRKSRYERLMEDVIKSGVKTKVLMLSATPVNINLQDLRNQIYFITEGKSDSFRESLGIQNYADTLKNAQAQFSKWADGAKHNIRDLLEALSASFFTLLDELTIARSRKHIEKYYNKENFGSFPRRKKPISKSPDIDIKERFMSYDKLNEEILHYKLSLFKPSGYVKDEYKNEYAKTQLMLFSQEDREKYLIGMMKINYMKRLESSVHSFMISMERTIKKIEKLEDTLKKYKKHKKENEIDISSFQPDENDDEEIKEAWQVGEKYVYNLNHLDVDKWLMDLNRDKKQLNELYLQAKDVDASRDAKLQELKDIIEKKVTNPTKTNNGKLNKKILIFTAFADTAEYLFNDLKEWAVKELKVNIAIVTGSSAECKSTYGKNDYNHILTNFAPYAKQREKLSKIKKDNEIDILIATDCISEGQNLQDCDLLVNYDIHWNPVRIIQRFGRIDRLNSPNDTIQLINFWPTDDLNKYIDLKGRVEARMALVDIAATGSDNVLDVKQIEEFIVGDMHFRDKQLMKLKDEILDLEEITEGLTLNEFTLDDFRIELSNYIEANRKILEGAPLGLFAIVPCQTDKASAKKGVVYCLKQKESDPASEEVNPLQPYFLVYVQEDGEIRYNFTHPKQILEVFRGLCQGNKQSYEDLCRLFDNETNNGYDMSRYNSLLERAVNAISKSYKSRMVKSLTYSRDGLLAPEEKQADRIDQFELITWLIIK